MSVDEEFSATLKRLVSGARLDAEESGRAFSAIMLGEVTQARMAAFLTALDGRAVFFVDEIHRLPRALEETFYPAMEDRRLPITNRWPG